MNDQNCIEMLKNNCRYCSEAISIDGEYNDVLNDFEQGSKYERNVIFCRMKHMIENNESPEEIIKKICSYLQKTHKN